MKIIQAFLWRDIQNEVSYSLSFVLQILNVFPLVLLFYYLSQLLGDLSTGPLATYGGLYFPFVLIGIAVQNYLIQGLNGFAASIREAQLCGTLEAVLAAPVSLPHFLFGSALYAFALNSVRVLFYLIVGALLCDARFEWSRLPAVFGVMILTIAAFSSLGIFSASFTILFKKGDPLNWVLSVSAWLLGGVYYPISVLPGWMQSIAVWIPITHSLEALRHLLLGNQGPAALSNNLAGLTIWALVGLPGSVLCFRFAVNRAKITGSLGHH